MVNNSLLNRLRHRRVGLVLGSAFFGFYSHCGFLSALRKNGIHPTVYGGSSAGAIIAAFGAADLVEKISPALGQLRRRDIWDPGFPTGHPAGILRGKKFAQILSKHLTISNFSDCLTPLVTVCTDAQTGTACYDRTGSIIDAVRASCAVPFMFAPVMRNGRPMVDGGLLDKAPIIATMETSKVDTIVVHLIENKPASHALPKSPIGFLNRALDLSLNLHWQQQAKWAQERGIDVFVISSRSQAVGPFSMHRGPRIINETYQRTLSCISDTRRPWKSGGVNQAHL